MKKKQQKARAQKQKEARRKARQQKAQQRQQFPHQQWETTTHNGVEVEHGTLGDTTPDPALDRLFTNTHFSVGLGAGASSEADIRRGAEYLIQAAKIYAKNARTITQFTEHVMEDRYGGYAGVHTKALTLTQDDRVRSAILDITIDFELRKPHNGETVLSFSPYLTYNDLGMAALLPVHKQRLLDGTADQIPDSE